nr:MAG TPA: hypothetical protein [Caudoviricetes sp.]
MDLKNTYLIAINRYLIQKINGYLIQKIGIF